MAKVKYREWRDDMPRTYSRSTLPTEQTRVFAHMFAHLDVSPDLPHVSTRRRAQRLPLAATLRRVAVLSLAR